MVMPNTPANLQVLPAGFNRMTSSVVRDIITLQFEDGTARNLRLLTVAKPVTPDSCATLHLQWRTPSPGPLTVVQGHGQTLELQIVDSCGNLLGPAKPETAS